MYLKRILPFILLNFCSVLLCFSQTEFITTWRTTTPNETIVIPTAGGGLNYDVNWGDGSPNNTGVTGDVSHIYTAAGTYTVTITGTFRRIFFDGIANTYPGNPEKIQSIEQWGVGRLWTSMSRAFEGCTNLVNNASDVPDLSVATSCQRMFRNASSIGNGLATNWTNWDVSNITNMTQMFRDASSFNEDLNDWNTASVTNMSNMFRGATAFNGNITSWNTTLVTNMVRMFNGATNFNQNIGGWSTGAVTSMGFMFRDATNFNQNIDGWIVTSVGNMDEMFRNATSFNQDLNSWNVANVSNMSEMFRNTPFNGNISSWTPLSVTNMSGMFREATNFNQNIGSWIVTSVTNMNSMFFNAVSFNQDIGGWNTLNVTDMANMFRNASIFNQDISGWNTGAVTLMNGMFRNADAFNQDIGGWNTINVTNMGSMFRDNNNAFDQDIGGWNISNVTNFANMFNGSRLSVSNYNALLVGWNAQSLQPNESLHAGSSTFCSPAAIAARANMMASDGWTFIDGGELTSFVWTGDTNTDWNTSTNWQDGYDTDCILDVVIPTTTNNPIINATDIFTANDVTINAGATLTIEGGLTVQGNLTTNDGLILNSGGSIIVEGTSTGNLTYNRDLPNVNEWYNVASPVGNETVENYITNNSLSVGSNSNIGLFYYNNNTTSGFAGSGFIFYQATSTGPFESARGYGTQISAGNISFTGTMPTNDGAISISEGTMGNITPDPNNLIGNPFPSYVAANSNANANNLLSNNTSILSEETLYFWDNTISDYATINNASPAFYVAPSQGFFVSSTSSGGAFTILEDWQSHQTSAIFFKSNTEPFRIRLSVTNTDNLTRFTDVFYFDNATMQFDNGFDSSKFSQNTDLDIYSQLVEGEADKNLAIQSLPKTKLETIEVPLHIVANKEISLSISTVNKPEGITIYLEDRLQNSFTKLDELNAITLDINENQNNLSRFYLHTKSKSLSTDSDFTNTLSVYVNQKELIILGDLKTKYNLSIYDVLGKLTLVKENIQSDRVSLNTLKKGVYVVQLKTKDGIVNKKILLKQ